MMLINLLLSRPFIKINACLIGYSLWLIVSQNIMVTRSITSQICFYQLAQDLTIIGPDSVTLSIYGQKKIINLLEHSNLAVHIDASKLSCGKHCIPLWQENLFLPEGINLLNLTPAYLEIQLQKIE